MKTLGNPRSYRLISLLHTLFKILKRLIYICVKPIKDPLLPRKQAGFGHGKLTVDQATLPTQEIEDTYSAKKKAGVVFIDLTVVYGTIWHCSLTCRLLCLLLDRHMVLLIMKLVQNRSLPLPLVLDCKAGYDASRMVSHRDQSLLSSYLTFIFMICQQQLQKNLPMLMT